MVYLKFVQPTQQPTLKLVLKVKPRQFSLCVHNSIFFFSCNYVLGESTDTQFIASKALALVGAIVCFISLVFIIVYLCENRACGIPRRLLVVILVIQIIGSMNLNKTKQLFNNCYPFFFFFLVIAAAAGAAIFFTSQMVSITNYTSSIIYGGFVFFAGIGLFAIAAILTIVEICLQNEPDGEEEMYEGGGGGGPMPRKFSFLFFFLLFSCWF